MVADLTLVESFAAARTLLPFCTMEAVVRPKDSSQHIRIAAVLVSAVVAAAIFLTVRSYSRSDLVTYSDVEFSTDEGLLSMMIPIARLAPGQRMRSKKLTLTVSLILVVGCVYVTSRFYNLDAPSVSIGNPIDVTWNHLQTERWGYTLHHDTRVAYLGFWPHGGVGATMGTRDGPLESVTGIGYQWRIKTPTRLEFTDEDGVVVYFTFDLNDLTPNSATVTDVSNGEVLSFTRTYHGRTSE